MISIKSLEFKTASVIRAGLRHAMRNADPRDIPASLRHAEDRLTHTLYNSLYTQIAKTYSEGYVSAGNLIRRHAPRETMVTAAAPVPIEDPRIAKATQSVIFGLKDSLGNHKNEIQAAMRAGFEKGESIPKLSRRLDRYFDDNRAVSTRMARTVTNTVYNRAHLDRYEDSGVVDGVQYSAHIDERTTDICQMLNLTIWGMGDSAIVVPPAHFACRSRLIPYFGKIPGKRDFKAQFGTDFVTKAEKDSNLFRSKYWSPMPHTKASATYQRTYFTKSDIKTVTTGLNQQILLKRTAFKKTKRIYAKVDPSDPAIASARSMMDAEITTIAHLKDALKYRKIDPAAIVDRYGKSMMLDTMNERDIRNAVKTLITQADDKIAKEVLKRKKLIDSAWKDVLTARKDIIKMEKDVLYYQKQIKAYPSRAAEYQKHVILTSQRVATAKAREARQIEKWNKIVDMKPSATTAMLEAEKERYQHLIDEFKFIKR